MICSQNYKTMPAAPTTYETIQPVTKNTGVVQQSGISKKTLMWIIGGIIIYYLVK